MITVPCPKCGRTLKQSGELSIDGIRDVIPTFQCDECLMMVDIMGEQMEVALTFALKPDGTLFDPADPDGKPRF